MKPDLPHAARSLAVCVLAFGPFSSCGKTAPSASADSDGPQFRAVILLGSASSSCAIESSWQQRSGLLTCGPADQKTQLKWKYAGRGPRGDLYELHWDLYPDRMPSSADFPVTTAMSNRIEYLGTLVVAMEHEQQRVVLHPFDASVPLVIDANTPRSP